MVIHDKEYGLQSISYKITKVTNNEVATTNNPGKESDSDFRVAVLLKMSSS